MKLFKSEALRISVIYFLITRLTLVLISYCVVNEFALHNIAKSSNYRFYDNDILNVWGNFDTGWYLKIAQEWYPEVHDRNFSFEQFSFFPLYPGLIRLFHFITGIDYFIIGLMISNICLLISGWLMYKITEKIYNKEIAKWSVIFMYLFPVSFIFSGVFSESLYVVIILSSFYFMSTQKWVAAGAAAFFLTLCRPVGAFILLPLAYEYFKNNGFHLKKLKTDIISLVMVPAAILILALNNATSSGKKFSLFNFYGSGYKLPVQNPILNLFKWLTDPFFTLSFLASFSLVVILFWILFYKHLKISFHIVLLYSLFIPMCYTLSSMPRMTLAAFPLFILVASVAVKYKAQNIFVIILTLLQGYLFVCWCLGFGNVI
jgi:Gpi18-like mannosyltransferase